MIQFLQHTLTISLIATLLLISGCGQTGPLYLPSDEDKTGATTEESTSY